MARWRFLPVTIVMLGVAVLALCCQPGRPVQDGSTCQAQTCRLVRWELDPKLEGTRADLRRALDLWYEGTGRRVCFEPGGSDLRITFLERREDFPDPARRPVGNSWVAACNAGSGEMWVLREALDGNMAALYAHEVGHFLRLEHLAAEDADGPTCMLPAGGGGCLFGGRIPARDRAAYCAAQGCRCAR